MMPFGNFFQALFSGNYWRYTVFTSDTLNFVLSRVSILWGLLNIARFFLKIPDHEVETHWELFVGVVAIWTFWERRPILSVSEKLTDRDIELEVKIGNIFKEKGAKIISLNTTFDTDVDNGIIAEDSLQGQFTRKFYNSVQDFDKELNVQILEHSVIEEVNSKKRGKTKRYELGTVIQVRPRGQLFYLVAIADFNEQGVAQSSFDTLKVCLRKTWKYIGQCGETDPIIIPLMGSGRARLTTKRITIAQEIIRSFVEACASKKCCEKFTVIISPDDYRKHDLNLYELGEFLKFICKYEDLDRLGVKP
jgi:Domain of unknown function (DUF6430)